MRFIQLALMMTLVLCAPAMAQVAPQVIHTTQLTDNGIAISGQVLVVSFQVSTNNCTTTCFAEIWDTGSIPADGTYVGASSPAFCYAIPPAASPNPWSSVAMDNGPILPRTTTGFAITVNSGADCYHLVKAAAYLSAQYSP